MRVLWITNSPLPEVYSKIEGRASVTSGWVNSAAKTLIEHGAEIELGMASFYNGKTLKQLHLNGMENYLIPSKVKDSMTDSQNDLFWRKINDDFKPDIIHIHGTEYPHAYSFVKSCGTKNVVVSIQGLVSVYERYYFGNIEKSDLKKTITFRDLFRFDTIFDQHRNMAKRGEIEKRLLKVVDHVIGRTSWDRDHIWALNHNATYHFCNETLRTAFYKNQWSISACEKYSIFVSQAQYPIKGFHQLVKALPIILSHYPKTKVYVAGHNFFSNRGIKIHGFGNYVNSLIRKYNLSEHIVFTGLLSEAEMCSRFVNSHVFVCPSSIENSPNSVGEAQLVGVPCVASYVGGTADMVTHGKTGLLYRFEEVEMLASNICELFSNDQLAIQLSEAGKISAAKRHDKETNATNLYAIYNKILAQDTNNNF